MPLTFPHIVFFDLELETPQDKKPQQYLNGGTVYNGIRQEHKQVGALIELASKGRCLCGHNIIAHDLPFLFVQPGGDLLKGIPVIDTLLLSPLLRPERESHRLDKDYKLTQASHPDPVMDAKHSEELLGALLDAWMRLSAPFRGVLKSLLHQDRRFKEFMTLYAVATALPADLERELSMLFRGQICRHAGLKSLINDWPVELAYVLAILDAKLESVFTPSWLLSEFPMVKEVFDRLRAQPCDDTNCTWCQTKLNPVQGLKDFFGHSSFRKFEGDPEGGMPLQEKAVRAALANESLLAIFPTGGGKSITFQLPALIRGRATGALTVVISPLVALMKDQVDGLKSNEIINAVAINSLSSPLERADAIEKVLAGIVSLLYISPESLRSNTILELLMRRAIDRFVIDEAHCFSAWGQDFRVEYQYIAKFIKKLAKYKRLEKPFIPVSCFTATARPEVISEIAEYFKKELGIDLGRYETIQSRKNLSYRAHKAGQGDERTHELIDILRDRPGATIVYVNRTKAAEKLCEQLLREQFPAAYYHGQMDVEKKKQVLEEFKQSSDGIIVATSAFGMGVDKSDIRMVVHYAVSQSLESYVQEAGRGGRDPKLDAKCVALFSEEDLDAHFFLLKQSILHKPEINKIWSAIKQFKYDRLFKTCLELAQKAGWDTEMHDLETKVKTAINALEIAGYIAREQNSPKVYPSSLPQKNLEEAKSVLAQKAHHFSSSQIAHAERILGYIFGKDEVRVDYMADRLGIRLQEVADILNIFKEIGILRKGSDISLAIDITDSRKGMDRCFREQRKLEPAFWEYLGDCAQGSSQLLNLREANSHLSDAGFDSELPRLLAFLRLWEWESWIRKSRVDANGMYYQIQFRKGSSEVAEKIQNRLELAGYIVSKLPYFASKGSDSSSGKLAVFDVALIDIKAKVEAEELHAPQNVPIGDYGKALLYLHAIRAIELRRGLLIHRTSLNITRLESNLRKEYTADDYKTLKKHYNQRVQQIHVIGEYVKYLLTDQQAAQDFMKAYFSMPFGAFLEKYFPKRKEEIRRPISLAKYKQVFKELSAEQIAPIDDRDSKTVLIAAGPGSGKTRVLVSKMVDLLIIDDVKPQQFLMLAFSRPAVKEFRERLGSLLPAYAQRIDLMTFHSFAFQLLGKLGDLEHSNNVLEQATEAIQEGRIVDSMVTGRMAIVLDEFQDVSEQEWLFLQAILDKAGECKLIAVGDDDQAIYGFRGGSSTFMKLLQDRDQAHTYYLTTNYRSARRLVEFSNAFLELLPSQERIKSGQRLTAHRADHGTLRLYRYGQGHIIPELVKTVMESSTAGTKAVLCMSNQEVMEAATLLRHHGVAVQSLSFQNDFPVRHLAELSQFTLAVGSGTDQTQGLITEGSWTTAIRELEQAYEGSEDLPFALRVIDEFGKATKLRYCSEWKAYLNSVRAEDFFQAEQDKVFVSTIHKAKGREFREVHLLMDGQSLHLDDALRVIYVGITRAMDALHVHTRSEIFNSFPFAAGERIDRPGASVPSLEIELQCGLEDIVLDRFLGDAAQKLISKLRAGQKLGFNSGNWGRSIVVSGINFPISKALSKRLDEYERRGYKVDRASVDHIVWWKKKDTDQQCLIVLPKIWMKR